VIKKITPKKIVPFYNYNYAATNQLLEACSLNVDNIYSLGCQENFHVSIMEQQSRALNLVWALKHKKILKEGTSIAIIGGGFAGCTAAVGAALFGASVDLFESGSKLLPRFNRAKNRWIHPNYFSQGLMVDDWTEFPILNWRADYAPNIRKLFLEKFNQYQDKLDSRINVNLNCSVIGIQLEYVDLTFLNPVLHWIDKKSKTRMPLSQDYDLYIIATGFGEDARFQIVKNGLPIKTKSYWSGPQKITTKRRKNIKKKERVFISGCGDGGIVELLEKSLINFKHEEVRKYIPPLPSLVMKRLEQSFEDSRNSISIANNIESHQLYLIKGLRNSKRLHNIDEFKRIALNKTNKEVTDYFRHFAKEVERLQPGFYKALNQNINRTVKIYLNSLSSSPYNVYSSIWNQLLLSLLERANAFEYIQGNVEEVIKAKDGYILKFEDRTNQKDIKKIDLLIQRYGQNSQFKNIFNNLIFNKIPDESKTSSECSSFIFEEFTLKMALNSRQIMENIEAVESIHSWYKRGDLKTHCQRTFKLEKKSKYFDKKDAKEWGIKFLKFSERAKFFDRIFIDSSGMTLSDEFVNQFSKIVSDKWNLNLPRLVFSTPVDSEQQINLHSNLIRMNTTDENYLKKAKKYFSNMSI